MPTHAGGTKTATPGTRRLSNRVPKMRSAVLWPKFFFRNGILTFALLAGLIGLLWFSLDLGAMRVFQVDECRNFFVARLLAVKKAGAAPGTGSLHYRPHT